MKFIATDPDLTSQTVAAIMTAITALPGSGTKIYDRKNQRIYRLQIGDQHVIAKTYKISSFSRTLAALLGFSRARRSFRASTLMDRAGIPTPKSLLLIEQGPIFYSSSILVTDYCEGPSLRKFLKADFPIPPTLIGDLKEILLGLKSAKLRHGDFHDDNVLMSPDGRPHVIDLDSARRRFAKKTVRQNIQADRDRLILSINYHSEFQSALIAALGAPGTPFPKP